MDSLSIVTLAVDSERVSPQEYITAESSPLVGEAYQLPFQSIQYLPYLEHRKEWKSDNITVELHSLSEKNFNPRYLHLKLFEGIQIVEWLPCELRRMVYDKLVHSWSSFHPFPETYLKNPEAGFGMARRNRIPAFDPFCDLPDFPFTGPCRSPDCPNDTMFEQKNGMLDYFKHSEWEDIKSSVQAMEDYRQFCDENTGLSLRGRPFKGRLDVLEEFMSWFWDEVVLDIRFNNLQQCSAPLHRFPVSELILHSRIRHVTLEASPSEAASDWYLRRFHANDERPSRDQNGFIQRCKFITAHLPNLQTTSLFINMEPEAIIQAQKSKRCSRRAYRRFKPIIPWLRTVNKIPAKEEMEFVVFLSPGNRCQTGNCDFVGYLNAMVEMWLVGLLSPLHMNRFDGDEYSGLSELFQEN